MPTNSPVTADDFPTYNSAAEACTKMEQLLQTSNRMKSWFEWAFDENGNWNPEAVQTIVLAASPIGTIMLWPGESLPSDKWLICNGSAVSRTTYATLFERVGTKFGSGDGATTFNLPNFTGRAPIGVGSDALGAQVGERTVTLTSSEMPEHDHNLELAQNAGADTGDGGNTVYGPTQGGFEDVTLTTDEAGSGDPHNNMQPSLAVYFIIRATP